MTRFHFLVQFDSGVLIVPDLSHFHPGALLSTDALGLSKGSLRLYYKQFPVYLILCAFVALWGLKMEHTSEDQTALEAIG